MGNTFIAGQNLKDYTTREGAGVILCSRIVGDVAIHLNSIHMLLDFITQRVNHFIFIHMLSRQINHIDSINIIPWHY